MAAKQAAEAKSDGSSVVEEAHALRLLVKEKLESKRKGADSLRKTMFKMFDADNSGLV